MSASLMQNHVVEFAQEKKEVKGLNTTLTVF